MPFSVLLLTAASSERHITGYSQDRVRMPHVEPGEVALFFDKLDDDKKPMKKGLNILNGQKCCDGIIFYASGERKVICLVEMKSSDLGDAKEQLKSTYTHISDLLKADCRYCPNYFSQITWLAYIYSASPLFKSASSYENDLKNRGFADARVSGNPDITSFLRGESETGKRKNNQKRGNLVSYVCVFLRDLLFAAYEVFLCNHYHADVRLATAFWQVWRLELSLLR
jgi:hypothetical protein